jgi:hypothetical protein
LRVEKIREKNREGVEVIWPRENRNRERPSQLRAEERQMEKRESESRSRKLRVKKSRQWVRRSRK